MTISAEYAPDQYAGNGTTTTFAVTFPFFTEDELEVILTVDATGVETVQTLNTDYTVTGGGADIPDTGSVEMTVAPEGAPDNETLTIRRITDRLQELDLTRGGPLAPNSLEGALDRAVMLDQEDEEGYNRCLHVPKSDDPTLDMELPSEVDRASAYLGFDSDGEPIALAPPTDTALTTTYTEQLLDDPDDETARATLDTFEDVFTSRGDILRAGASAVEEALPLGAIGHALKSDGTDAVWAIPWPPYYISGFAMSGPTGTTWEVNFGIGAAMAHTTPGTTDNTFAGVFSTASFTKKLAGSAWAAGSGSNGLANGADAIAADNWYAAFLMVKTSDGSCDIGFDSDPNAVNLKSDASAFDRFRFIGWVQVDDGAADVDPFDYDPDSGLWLYRNVRTAHSGVADTDITLDIPEGNLVVAVNINMRAGAVQRSALLQHVDSTDAPDNSNQEACENWVAIRGATDSAASTGSGPVMADSSKQIRMERGASAPDALEVGLRGFYVRRSDR